MSDYVEDSDGHEPKLEAAVERVLHSLGPIATSIQQSVGDPSSSGYSTSDFDRGRLYDCAELGVTLEASHGIEVDLVNQRGSELAEGALRSTVTDYDSFVLSASPQKLS